MQAIFAAVIGPVIATFGPAIAAVLKSYLINLASKQFIDFVLFEVAEAAVKSTKTDYDDKFLQAVKAAAHGEPIQK